MISFLPLYELPRLLMLEKNKSHMVTFFFINKRKSFFMTQHLALWMIRTTKIIYFVKHTYELRKCKYNFQFQVFFTVRCTVQILVEF